MLLRDQSASTAADALSNDWIMYHGNRFYLLSDQGSNVDGLVMNEICLKFRIEKRRSSAYHSQGNGFEERHIRSVCEILRSVFLDKNVAQKYWRQLLPGVVFALNMSKSKAIKCILYNVVFGRPAVLPQDFYCEFLRNSATQCNYRCSVWRRYYFWFTRNISPCASTTCYYKTANTAAS